MLRKNQFNMSRHNETSSSSRELRNHASGHNGRDNNHLILLLDDEPESNNHRRLAVWPIEDEESETGPAAAGMISR